MHETDAYYFAGVLVRFVSRHAENGRYCLVEATCAPGAGAPPNRHPGEDESFFVIEGRFGFQIAGEERVAGPGDWVKVPDGAVHAFRNIGDAPGRLLVLNAPGAMHDLFFSEAGRAMPPGTRELPQDASPPDVPRILAAMEKSGMEFAGGR